MTGPFDKKDDEFDWDSELSKWEKAFEPEIAKEPKTPPDATPGLVPAAATPAETPNAPPVPERAPPPPASSPSLGASPAKPPRPAPSAPRLPNAPPVPVSTKPRVSAPLDLTGGEEEEPTHVKEVPTGLRQTAPPPAARPSRGGLAQLFGRGEPPSSRGRMSTRPAAEEIENAANEAGIDLTSLPPSAPPRPAAGRVPSEEDPQEVTRVSESLDALRKVAVSSAPPAAPIVGAGGLLLAPGLREHDPDGETSVVEHLASLPQVEGTSDAPTAGSFPIPSLDGPALEITGGAEEPYELPELPPVASAESELEVVGVIDPEAQLEPVEEAHHEEEPDPMLERADWLEDEARRRQIPGERARGLLAVSEIHAARGDRASALRLAVEARDLAPELPLTHVQLRGLLPPSDKQALLDALEVARRYPTTREAALHDVLLAAIAEHVTGNDEAMTEHWREASRIAPDDARVILGSAALSLATGKIEGESLAIPEREDLVTVVEAVHNALRARGAKAPAPKIPLVDESLRHAREAIAKGDLARASEALAALRTVPELEGAASWATFALAGAVPGEARVRSAEAIRGRSTRRARRGLAARGLELGDVELVQGALASADAFSADERLALGLLAGADEVALHELDGLGDTESSFVAAAASLLDRGPTTHLAGSAAGKRALRLARSLAAGSDDLAEAVLQRADDSPEEARALLLSLSLGKGEFSEVSDALTRSAPGDSDTPDLTRSLTAALVAERARDTTRAASAYEAARRAEPRHEGALRALASLRPELDLASALTTLAEEAPEGAARALLAIEAVTRTAGGDDDARLVALEAAHKSAPELPVAPFLAERIARRRGAEELLLQWVRSRRAAANDPLEKAIDSVREALLVADVDAPLASERLEEAHRARPDDVALRELHERLAATPLDDRAAWREARAAKTVGSSRQLLLLEAALEHERSGEGEKARADAEAAVSAYPGLSHVVRDRLDLANGVVARLADDLLNLAKTTADPRTRREAYERLAEIDLEGRGDAASALLWHRAVLDESPDHLASLRYVENAFISAGGEELEAVATSIARALDGTPGGECAAHAELASRLRMRAGDWLGTYDLAALAKSQPSPTTFALRLYNAHARVRGDAAEELESTRALIERSTRPSETASLLVEAAGAAERMGDATEAQALLERAVNEDPNDWLAWDELSAARHAVGDLAGAAEALEAAARVSLVRQHQLEGYYAAATAWLDEAKNTDRAIAAFEHVAAIEITYKDTFAKLSGCYAAKGARSELANLLERRSATVTDPAERVQIDLERGRVLADVGDTAGARAAFEAALEREPDHAGALAASADLAAKLEDWDGAEKAWVRLARLLATPEEQKEIYVRLGDLYAERAVNLSRAEVAYKEVLKRAEGDVPTLEKLVRVHKKQGDAAQALAAQQTLLQRATTPNEKRQRTLELADVYETVVHDNRKAEQTLDAARRELPTDVVLLRALAEFYARHKQTPAVHILLDRAAADTKRAFAAGRFSPALFEVMATVHDLRGKKDAARAVNAALAAFSGTPSDVPGAGTRAADPRLDDLLAPEVVTPALRSLFARTGAALDAAFPLDPRTLRPTPLPASARDVAEVLQSYAQAMGLSGVQVFVSPTLGPTCVAAGGASTILVLGEPLLSVANERARAFLLIRSLKLLQTRASALTRVQGRDLPVLVAAWLMALNPSWQPQGMNPAQIAEVTKRLQPGLPKKPDPDLGLLALEVAGALGAQATILGPAMLGWVNRTALLALGDPNAALEGIALSQGTKGGLPSTPAERATWIGRTAEARDLLAFSVTDAFADARTRSGAG